MTEYLNILRDVFCHGVVREDRTGVGTRGVFGRQMRIDLADGFPLLTSKKIHFKSVAYELLWFLRGDTNVKFLQDNGVTIWNEWADENGDLGPVYGKQWRYWATRPNFYIDQITNLINDLKTNPYSRRHIVTAWNPADVPSMKLPPCHTLWQCYVEKDHESGTNQLSLHLYMRSCDVFLGLPYNIASYALLLELLAKLTDMTPYELVISFGDLHLYRNHSEQAQEQLRRPICELPKLQWNRIPKSVDDFQYTDVTILNYNPQPAIKAPIAV